ncbi:methionine adenosyltransferase [Bacteroides acidifaciens]|uniref:methionine adenosyltransferase n=1 Tax=Bacteroides acidifaciens TaxID=85831 RepID=UPI00263BD0D8|nr:methionine adenosyltransferase [Bacteroides acidifaciens]
MEESNIARIGFFGDKHEFEVYVVTDDTCMIPHFHVRDALKSGVLNASLRLDVYQYVLHGKSKDRLQDYTLSLLADFMAQPCRSPHYRNNYEYTVNIWNMNNETQLSIKFEDDNIIIPDYQKTNINNKKDTIMNKKTVVCEYVGFGHPDVVADMISDAILDEFLKKDPKTRAGIEVMVKDNIVVLGGEIKSQGRIDYDSIVRRVFESLPYPANHHLSADEIKVINLIGKQSPEISRGVDKEDGSVNAGDQGWVCAMATNETEDYLPLGVHVAKKICQYVASQTELGLGPDCKSQVIVDYDKEGHGRIDSILVSTMHQGNLENDRQVIFSMIQDNKIGFCNNIFSKYFLCDDEPKIIINPNGEWRIGGSVSDCGITGRKIVVNQFGGYCPVGGGNLHGKCMSKVDRSAAYMCRYLAKNIVAAGVASTAIIELSYIIGEPQPSSINVELTDNLYDADDVTEWIKANVDLSPSGIIKRFDGGYPRYFNTARFGHYGKTDKEMQDNRTALSYPWEKTDLASDLFHFLNTKK